MGSLHKIIKLAIAGFFILVGSAQQSWSQQLTVKEQKEDIEVLESALKDGFAGLYWYSSKAEVEETLDRLNQDINEVATVRDLHRSLAGLVEIIGCGHTTILLPQTDYLSVDSIDQYLPFTARINDNRLYVYESFDSLLISGDEILSINGLTTQKILAYLADFVPKDLGIGTKALRTIEINFTTMYALYIGQDAAYQIEASSGIDIAKKSFTVKSIGYQDKFYRNPSEFVSSQLPIQFYKTEKYAYLKLSTLGKDNFTRREIDFTDTIAAVFSSIKSAGISALYLDLRYNNGGTMQYAEQLLTYFIRQPVDFYAGAKVSESVASGQYKYASTRNMLPMLDKMYPGYKIVEKVIYLQGGPGRLKPDTNNFTGDLYVLVNGLTFSATTGFLAQLQEQNIGIYVGETPGGAYRGLNAGPPVVVTLPNSGLRLFFRPICTEYKVTQARDRLDIDFEIEWTNGYFDLDFEDEVKNINSLLKN